MIEAENVNHCKSCLFIYLAMLPFHSKGANNFGVDFIGVYYLGLSIILPHAFFKKIQGCQHFWSCTVLFCFILHMKKFLQPVFPVAQYLILTSRVCASLFISPHSATHYTLGNSHWLNLKRIPVFRTHCATLLHTQY